MPLSCELLYAHLILIMKPLPEEKESVLKTTARQLARDRQRLEEMAQKRQAMLRRYMGLDLKIQVLLDEVQRLKAKLGGV